MFKALKCFKQQYSILILIYVLIQTPLIYGVQPIALNDNELVSDQEINEMLSEQDLTIDKDVEAEINKNFENDGFNLNQIINKFNNKILMELPLFTAPAPFDNFKINVGIYGEDIIKFTLWGTDLYIDKYLYKELKIYYANYILNQINLNYEKLIDLIEKSEAEKNRLEELSEEDTESKKENILEKELFDFIAEDHFLSHTKLIKGSFVKKISLYFLFSEFSRIAKQFLLNERYITTFNSFFKDFWNHGATKFLSGRPISIFQFMNFINRTSDLYSMPLYAPTKSSSNFGFIRRILIVINIISSLFIEFTQFYYSCEEQSKDCTDFIKFWKPYFKFMQSYYSLFCKEILILFFSLKSLNEQIYSKIWPNFLKNNLEEFYDLLIKYKSSKTELFKKSEDFKTKFKNSEENLKNFILRGHDISFPFWLKNKNIIFEGRQNKIDLIINLPVYYLMWKKIYQVAKSLNWLPSWFPRASNE